MWNLKNLFISSIFGFCDLIKPYWLAALDNMPENNFYKIVIILDFSVGFIYFASRFWGKYSKKNIYILNEWDDETQRARFQIRRAFLRLIVEKEAGKPAAIRQKNIQRGIILADRQIEQALQLFETMKRIGIRQEELNALREINNCMKEANDKIDMQQRNFERNPVELPQADP